MYLYSLSSPPSSFAFGNLVLTYRSNFEFWLLSTSTPSFPLSTTTRQRVSCPEKPHGLRTNTTALSSLSPSLILPTYYTYSAQLFTMDSDSNKDRYKGGEQYEHAEEASPSPIDIEISDAALNPTEQVAYGKPGVRGLISSPFIFGAALLASMGGFSFGYDQ